MILFVKNVISVAKHVKNIKKNVYPAKMDRIEFKNLMKILNVLVKTNFMKTKIKFVCSAMLAV